METYLPFSILIMLDDVDLECNYSRSNRCYDL